MRKLPQVLTALLSAAALVSVVYFNTRLRKVEQHRQPAETPDTRVISSHQLCPTGDPKARSTSEVLPLPLSAPSSATRKSDTPLRLRARLPTICATESCRADYEKHLQQGSADEFPVPKIRHFLWKNQFVSGYFAQQLLSWKKLHPDWTYVLWRDADMEPFVAAQFPGLLGKFKSLPHHIMRVDMIRYMLLFKFGGVYADLDYTLVRSLDRFRRFHAVVTREPDPHSLQFLGMAWPVKPLANPAFLMSAPGHNFYHSVMQQLESRAPTTFSVAGPFGLTEFMERYQRIFPVANHPLETVYIPPAHSFYPYQDNRLSTSRIPYVAERVKALIKGCRSLMIPGKHVSRNLTMYCADVNNLDPITDSSQPVYAVHDLQKTGSIWYGAGTKFYNDNLTDSSKLFDHFLLGPDL